MSTPTLDSQKAVEDAFTEAANGFFFLGEPLRNYGPSRVTAAQSMGLLYPYIGDAAFDQFERTGIYPGEQKDVSIVLWLCSLKDVSELTLEDVKAKVWTPSRALDQPGAATEEALRWAFEKGISNLSTPQAQEGIQVFMAIVSGIEASKFVLHVEGVAPTTGEELPPEGPAGPPKV